MKAVEFILEHVDPMKILTYYGFHHLVETEDQIRACCEIHKGNNPTAFIWNKANNLWFCYTGPCHGGDVFTLIEKMEGVDFITSVRRAAEILGLNITGMPIERQTDIVLNNTKKWLQFMKKHITQSACCSLETTNNYELPHTKYFDSNEHFTRYNSEILTEFDAKFVNVYPTDDGLLYNKLVIPIKQGDILRGVALRDITGKNQPKWFYQPKGLHIGTLLYNFDNAVKFAKENKLTELILVEGIFDVWAYHSIDVKNVVAIFGSTLKPEQASMLLQSAYDIVLSFDNDDAGRKCTAKIIKEYKYKMGIKVIDLPDGKDPGDLTPDELLDAYMKRRNSAGGFTNSLQQSIA